ncbi:HAD-IIB family hydrolase [Cupriavidus gilardii]|uniref:HAD-IIB family hydrolase n=1 Tax=Cupriavidus gilardii TaxID=82541 RepID=UPI001572BA27|nr:HAD-IIB family hydrolase [Cupriavidus gilardii]NSX06193.1 HAD-IIB family hydrolase [Cupriavidus gilardii]
MSTPQTPPALPALPVFPASLPAAALRRVRGVLTDIDGTLTTAGRLPAQTYLAIERLRHAGLQVIPVTGRCIAWAEILTRLWPVDAIIGENGAFYSHLRDGRLVTRFIDDAPTRAHNLRRIHELGERILREVPGCALASDQHWHAADLAIDHAEDVAPLPPAAVDRIVALMHEAGMTATVSSIHVNGWFGQHDKLSTSRLCAAELLGADLDAQRDEWVFIGDSANDASMFAHFPLSVGVANVREILPLLPVPPAYVTEAPGGEGFAEMVDALLAARDAG